MFFCKDKLFNSNFRIIQEVGGIDDEEMLRTFNCGIGMLVVVDRENFVKLEKIYNTQNIRYCELGYVNRKNTLGVSNTNIKPGVEFY